LNKLLQHVSETIKTYATCATSPIYFYNIHMKDLQQSFKTSEMLETYICNIGEGKRLCRSIPAVGVGAGGESRCVSTICIQHQQSAREPAPPASGLDQPGGDARDGRTSTTGTGACDERVRELTCKFHSGDHSVLLIGMEHSGTGRYRCIVPDFKIILIYEYTYT
jgi:hypothetical protein